uniref:Uncharacterized protein n=1 Tax=Anguilla anguilla TaxID=7936 RepID=A0A0E9S334_ANGAN
MAQLANELQSLGISTGNSRPREALLQRGMDSDSSCYKRHEVKTYRNSEYDYTETWKTELLTLI